MYFLGLLSFIQGNFGEICPGCSGSVSALSSSPLVWIHRSVFIHSLVDAHLGFFLFGAIRKKAAMNVCVQVFVWTSAFIALV